MENKHVQWNGTKDHLSSSKFYRSKPTYTVWNHQNFDSPRKGNAIMYDLEERINASVFPGLKGGPHNQSITALAVALKQANSPEFLPTKNLLVCGLRSEVLSWFVFWVNLLDRISLVEPESHVSNRPLWDFWFGFSLSLVSDSFRGFNLHRLIGVSYNGTYRYCRYWRPFGPSTIFWKL